MEVQFSPDVQAELDRLADVTGRPSEEFVQVAVSGYFAELAEIRTMIDRRYFKKKRGEAKLVSSEEAIEHFRKKSAAHGS